MIITLSKKINYKGTDLIYHETDKGTLFSGRSLFILRYPWLCYNSKALKTKISPHLIVPLTSWKNTVNCVGLQGVQQLFADKPDPELERLLISLNIIQGDIPYSGDIRCFYYHYDSNTHSYKYKKLFNPPCIDKLDWHIQEHQSDFYSALKVRVAYAFTRELGILCYINFNDLIDVVQDQCHYDVSNTKIYEVEGLIEIPDENSKDFYDRLYVSYNDIYNSVFKCFRVFSKKGVMKNLLTPRYFAIERIKNLNSSIAVKQKTQNTLIKDLQQLVQKFERENKKLRQELQIQKRLCYNF